MRTVVKVGALTAALRDMQRKSKKTIDAAVKKAAEEALSRPAPAADGLAGLGDPLPARLSDSDAGIVEWTCRLLGIAIGLELPALSASLLCGTLPPGDTVATARKLMTPDAQAVRAAACDILYTSCGWPVRRIAIAMRVPSHYKTVQGWVAEGHRIALGKGVGFAMLRGRTAREIRVHVLMTSTMIESQRRAKKSPTGRTARKVTATKADGRGTSASRPKPRAKK